MCSQTDGSSCGVLAAFSAAYYMHLGGTFPNARDHFSQSDVRNLRDYMQYILFRIKDHDSTLDLTEESDSYSTDTQSTQEVVAEIYLSQQKEDEESLPDILRQIDLLESNC
jgi:hypothetical protein